MMIREIPPLTRSEAEEAVKFFEAMISEEIPAPAHGMFDHWIVENPIASAENVALHGIQSNFVMQPSKMVLLLKRAVETGLIAEGDA